MTSESVFDVKFSLRAIRRGSSPNDSAKELASTSVISRPESRPFLQMASIDSDRSNGPIETESFATSFRVRCSAIAAVLGQRGHSRRHGGCVPSFLPVSGCCQSRSRCSYFSGFAASFASSTINKREFCARPNARAAPPQLLSNPGSIDCSSIVRACANVENRSMVSCEIYKTG